MHPPTFNKCFRHCFTFLYSYSGLLKTAYVMRAHAYFPSFHRIVRSTVNVYDVCQKCKPKATHIVSKMSHIISSKPLEKMLLRTNIRSPLHKTIRYMYIFVVINNITRHIKLHFLYKAIAKACLKQIVNKYIPYYGFLESIVSDYSWKFISEVWRESLYKKCIHVSVTSEYHPQSNPSGQVMRELEIFLENFSLTVLLSRLNTFSLLNGLQIM